MELKGINGVLTVLDDYVEISRKTVGGFVSQGGSAGTRRIYFKDMNSIEFKSPSFWANGYLKFVLPGVDGVNAAVGPLGNNIQSSKDPNTLLLRGMNKTTEQQSNEVYTKLVERLDCVKKSGNQGSTSSKMDELKNLADLKASGVLTENEFLLEKEKILAN